jgi:shikimate kinase
LTDERQAIVLIGMPGAGKSTVGPALAQLMQWRFVDVDDLVGNPAEIIERDGLDAFRAQEAEAIQRVAMQALGMVVSVGGGAVLDPTNRAALDAAGPIVWLRATLDTLLDHVGDGEGRPLLKGGAHDALSRLLAERTPIYDDFADVVIDVDGLDPNEIAVEVVKAVCE